MYVGWGCSSARESTSFARRGSGVQIPSAPLGVKASTEEGQLVQAGMIGEPTARGNVPWRFKKLTLDKCLAMVYTIS